MGDNQEKLYIVITVLIGRIVVVIVIKNKNNSNNTKGCPTHLLMTPVSCWCLGHPIMWEAPDLKASLPGSRRHQKDVPARSDS